MKRKTNRTGNGTTADFAKENTTPVIKWVGGKRQLLGRIVERMPLEFGTYFEPFFGGGALFCSVRPEKAVINDFNKKLIGMYRQVRNSLEEVIAELTALQDRYNALQTLDEKRAMFITARAQFNDIKESTPIAAALFIFLNKTCFNGLYRVNKAGNLNSPFGQRMTVNCFDRDNINGFSALLESAEILCGDFEQACAGAKAGDFVFLDPPYFETFDTYQAGGFSLEDHKRLARMFRELTDRGVYCMLTNSNNDLYRELYKGFQLEVVPVKRMVNRNANGRTGEEIIITNYTV